MLGLVGRAAKGEHRGEGSSRGQENGALSIETSSSNASRGGEPPTNGGCSKQPVDTRPRVGNSVVREQDVQERNSQEGYDPDSDFLSKWITKKLSGEGESTASEGDEDKEWTSGEDEKRCGSGGGLKRKSGSLDKGVGEGSGNRNQRLMFSKKDLPPLPNPPPEMPGEFKDKINGSGGKEVILVMQKVILYSDMSSQMCRLSLPKNQFKEMGFLREGERRKLDAREEIPVRVIFPNLSEKDLIFTVWEMRKKGKSNAKKAELAHNKDGKDNREKRAKRAKTAHGNNEDGQTETKKAKSTDEQGKDGTKELKPSLMYVLRTGWRAAAEESGLAVLDRIQVWSFRVDSDACQDRLCFALIRLPREDRSQDATGCSNHEEAGGCSTSKKGSNTAHNQD
ncbi:hypothetical protein NL676_017916 [Syzygium grande]|nr:hypothetical protein NL676_017916 [Syzygium grande]